MTAEPNTDRRPPADDVAEAAAVSDPATVATLDEDLPTGSVITVLESPTSDALRVPVKRRRKRKPVRRTLVRLHRWLSFAFGLGLLVVTTSGAILLYQPEWTVWTNSAVFDVTATSDPISMPDALGIVDQAHPDFLATSVNLADGLYWVMSSDYEGHPGFWGVDPGTGDITGYVDTNAGFMALMAQVHECFFSCDGYPAFVPFLADPVPTLGMAWLDGVTWAGFLLGMSAILLIFLALSGLWLWWPGIKRWSHGFRVRRGKGRYARDFDLHQLVGLIGIPFLLMWGITGAGFEFPWVAPTWYALTGGEEQVRDTFTATTVPDGTPDIGLAAAIDAAQNTAGPDATLVYAGNPTDDDPTAGYSLWFDHGHDNFEYGSYPGEYSVTVDRHDADNVVVADYGSATTLSNRIYDVWGAPMLHYGLAVNGWWRIIWFVFGITPLFLAITGISTWLAKRSVRVKRRQAAKERAERERAAQDDAGADAPPPDPHAAVPV